MKGNDFLKAFLFSLTRLGIGRKPALVGAVTMGCLYGGLGRMDQDPLMVLVRLALLMGLGSLLGRWAGRRLEGRRWRVMSHMVPVLWLLPVGQILGGFAPGFKWIWAILVGSCFLLSWFRGIQRRPFAAKDVRRQLQRSTWWLAVTLATTLALLLILS